MLKFEVTLKEIVETAKGTKYLPVVHGTKLAKSETNDCVVRAVAAAFELEYDAAHAWIKDKFNRKNKKGTFGAPIYFRDVAVKDEKVLGKKVSMLGDAVHGMLKTTYNINKWNMTFGTFQKIYKTGTFILFVRKHAFVLRDGVVIGNSDDATRLRTRIHTAFQIG